MKGEIVDLDTNPRGWLPRVPEEMGGRAAAILKWNTRQPDPIMQEVREVLGFYADFKVYDGHYMMSPPVISDQGKKARALLKKLEEVKP